jgi:hypothetical protein
MNIKIAILLSTMISTLTCCKTNDKIHISDNLIEKIAKEDQILPSQYSNLNMFTKCQDNKIGLIDVHYLRDLYRSSIHTTDYETFIRNVLNQSLKIDCKDVPNKFELDSSIYHQYDKIGLKSFLNSYCTKKGANRYHLNKDLTINKTNSVLYILFLNNYISSKDDYLGMTVVREIKN